MKKRCATSPRSFERWRIEERAVAETYEDIDRLWEQVIRKGFWITVVACFLFGFAAWLLVR